MAYNWINVSAYNGKIITNNLQDYPYGQARNITNPGDGTGTPWDQTFINDLWGWMAAMLAEANITPNGNAETARASQYLTAMTAIIRGTAASTTQRGSVELATNAETPISDATKAVTPAGYRANTFAINQSLQDLTSSRTVGTLYTNVDAKPRLLLVTMTDPVAGADVTVSIDVDGSTVSRTRLSPANATTGGAATAFAIVPAGSTYQVGNAGGDSVESWWEYR